MGAINAKRVNWRLVAEERGSEVNTLRAQVLTLESGLATARQMLKQDAERIEALQAKVDELEAKP